MPRKNLVGGANSGRAHRRPAMSAQAPPPTMAVGGFSFRPGCGDESVGANRAAVGEPAWAWPAAPIRTGVDRLGRFRGDGLRWLLSEPPDDGDSLFRARPRRY